MTEQTLTAYIRQQIEAQPAGMEEIHFHWQGGEPTLLGLEFFRSVIKIQQQHILPIRFGISLLLLQLLNLLELCLALVLILPIGILVKIGIL